MLFISKKISVGLLILVLIIGVSTFFYGKNSSYTVILDNKQFLVDVVRSPKDMERGLSGRKSLPEDRGMLFVFDKPGNYGFWMKEMNFPIDIVWISNENKIVHIEKSLSPVTYPTIYYPNGLTLYVLEIGAGQSEILNLKIGDEVKFSKK